MPKYDTLYAELWTVIFSQLGDKDRRSAVATSRYFRAWRGLAWSELRIPVPDGRDLGLLVERLTRLSTTITADVSLQSYIRSISLRRSKARCQWSAVTDWAVSSSDDRRRSPILNLDLALARILGLVQELECFVFEAPLDLQAVFAYKFTPRALCGLPVLKTLVLAQVPVLPPSGASTPDHHLASHALQRLIIVSELRESPALDFDAYLGEQKLLKSATLPIDQHMPLDMATSWVALEELTMCRVDSRARDPSMRWQGVVEKGLVIIRHALKACRAPLISLLPTGQWSTSPAKDAVDRLFLLVVSPFRAVWSILCILRLACQASIFGRGYSTPHNIP